MVWSPHVTVASVIEKNGRFLLVQEKDESGKNVFNQPAGHLEPNETLLECAIRESLEETGWIVEPIAALSVRLYTSAANNITYLRTNVICKAIEQKQNYQLDTAILSTHWLSPMEIKKFSSSLRSPLVLEAVDDYLSGTSYPLSVLQASMLQAKPARA